MKLDYTLAPPEFDDVVLVLQHSAETGKYGRNDWLKGKNFDTEKSISSIKRHLTDYRNGIRHDKDNNLHPMLMVACRALMQYTLDKKNENKLGMYDDLTTATTYNINSSAAGGKNSINKAIDSAGHSYTVNYDRNGVNFKRNG